MLTLDEFINKTGYEKLADCWTETHFKNPTLKKIT